MRTTSGAAWSENFFENKELDENKACTDGEFE